jgi:hypothetical protein
MGTIQPLPTGQMMNFSSGRGFQVGSIMVFMVGLLLCMTVSVRAVDVPPQDDIYPFLTRLELKGAIEGPLSRSLPYSRTQIANYLVQAASNRNDLTSVEKRQLNKYLFLYSDILSEKDERERPRMGFEKTRSRQTPFRQLKMYRNPRYAWTAEGSDWLIGFNLHADLGFESVSEDESGGSLNRVATGLSVFGRHGPFQLLMNVRDAHLSGDMDLADPQRYPIRFNSDDREGEGFGFDETDALVSYEAPHIYAVFGKTSNVWAPGATGTPSLSSNSLPYAQARLRLSYGPLEITWVQGKLTPNPPIIYQTVVDSQIVREEYAEKWIAGHRYEFRVIPNLQIGIYDMVVYGNRGIDWDYLPPTTFLWSAEHYNHDRDNVMMGLDFRYTPGARIEIIANWFLDELMFSRAGSDWFGNKHGYQLGVHAVDPVGLPNTDLELEGMLLRPYVYTHTDPINVAQHYGSNIGSPLQPNSVQYLLRVRHRPLHSILLWGQATVTVHGNNTETLNVGGDVHVPFTDGGSEDETAGFLDGDLERNVSGTLGIDWEIDPRLYLRLSGSVTRAEWMPVNGTSSERTITRVDLSLTWNPHRWQPGFHGAR